MRDKMKSNFSSRTNAQTTFTLSIEGLHSYRHQKVDQKCLDFSNLFQNLHSTKLSSMRDKMKSNFSSRTNAQTTFTLSIEGLHSYRHQKVDQKCLDFSNLFQNLHSTKLSSMRDKMKSNFSPRTNAQTTFTLSIEGLHSYRHQKVDQKCQLMIRTKQITNNKMT